MFCLTQTASLWEITQAYSFSENILHLKLYKAFHRYSFNPWPDPPIEENINKLISESQRLETKNDKNK